MNVLQAIRYQGEPKASLEILDQLQLPHRSYYESVQSSTEGWNAIRTMKTRGAPAIAIVAALSLAVELSQRRETSSDAASEAHFIRQKLDYLVSSRPTAVNLEDAAQKLGRLVNQTAARDHATAMDVRTAYIAAAEKMLVDDVHDNEAIGQYGAQWILEHSASKNAGENSNRGANVITHCNTGSLATAGYGTALGIIRSLNTAGKLRHAYCTETRPYNQGSRLTAYELVHDGIPATLITDSMAASLMQLGKKLDSATIDAVIVGADRVTANGDTANKIGTYSLAVLAKQHGAKFIVAAPRTSIDLVKDSGDQINIEERPQHEVTLIKGPLVDGEKVLDTAATISLAPMGINVWNPAFDVTPAELIDVIVTESGIIEKDAHGEFPLREFFSSKDRQVHT